MIAALVLELLLVHGSWMSFPGPHSKQSAGLSARLSAHVQNYTLSADSFVQALLKLASDFEIPMGIEWVRTPTAIRPVHLTWKDTDVRAIIHGIAQTQSGYEVDVEEAVVHIRQRELVPARQNFLSIRLARFEVHDDVAEIASKRLASLVRLRLAPPKPIVAGGVGFSQGTEIGDPNISLNLQNPTVEDVLDVLTLASPFKIWLVTFGPDRSLTPTGFRRTVSPVTGKAVPGAEQPVWELLKWGRAPY